MQSHVWLSRLFPEVCPACRGPTSAGFCTGCRADFSIIPDPCPRCGLSHRAARCPSGFSGSSLAAIYAPFRYCAPLDHYVQALKFSGARKLGRALGLLLAEPTVATAGFDTKPCASHSLAARAAGIDALVPVPLHSERLRQRGYNQAVEIAHALTRKLELPVLVHGIERPLPTAPQAGLTAKRRHLNVAGAFKVRRSFDDMRLAVIDDVITTGATVDALARALLAAGAWSVEAWAVARTP